MKTRYLLKILPLFVLILSVQANTLTISNITVHQRWPWSKLVDIDYVITNGVEPVDISVKAYNGVHEITIAPESLSGDIYAISGFGKRRITWDPTKSNLADAEILTEFKVELSHVPSPLYMIVDITKAPGDDGHIEYVYEKGLTNGLWGAWERNPINNLGTPINSVIWTGVTTNDIYKTNKLVLRRIPAGSFQMGRNLNIPVTLTKPFYMAVFEFTQRQWELIMDKIPGPFTHEDYYATRPAGSISYNTLRGTTNINPELNIDWPHTGYKVNPTSFFGKFREHTGLDMLDLPTEAQWEYACRAGTSTYYCDGMAGTPDNVNSNAQMDVLGRYRANGGRIYNEENNTWSTPPADSDPKLGTATVGSYLPNAWGLYDMQGNQYEWCLDWYSGAALKGGIDPVGVPEGPEFYRVKIGGAWFYDAATTRPGLRSMNLAKTGDSFIGFRLVLILP